MLRGMKKVIVQISVSINFIDLNTLSGVYTSDLAVHILKQKRLIYPKAY
jgi:hypothetical protein